MTSKVSCMLLALSMSVAGAVHANDLDAAGRLLANKQYREAFQAYSQLAGAGNAEAKLRLGEMHWYGEGVAVDRAKADALFAQAAAAGNQAAVAATTLSSRRAASSAEIAAWTEGKIAAELKAAACKSPAIPAQSNSNAGVAAVNAELGAWVACHQRHLDTIAGFAPANSIPLGILDLMSDQEIAQVKMQGELAAAQEIAAAQEQAERVLAGSAAWKQATLRAMVARNKEIALWRESVERHETYRTAYRTERQVNGK